jgi:hypothetical protein
VSAERKGNHQVAMPSVDVRIKLLCSATADTCAWLQSA